MAIPRAWDTSRMGATLALRSRTPAVLIALTTADIPFLMLKGPVTSEALYGEQTRPYRDIDLLVPPSHYTRAETVLTTLGFEAETLFANDRPWHARTWARADGVDVDLHRTLLGATGHPQDVWEALIRDSVTIRLDGREIPAPGLAALALHLALHAAQDGGHNERSRNELALALSVFEASVWEAAEALADEIGASNSFALGVLLGKSAGVPHLGQPYPLTREQRLRVALTGQEQNAALAVNHLLELPRFRERLRFAAGKISPPPAFMRSRYRIARRGPPGLVIAYFLRILWLTATFIRSFAGARRALFGRDTSRVTTHSITEAL